MVVKKRVNEIGGHVVEKLIVKKKQLHVHSWLKMSLRVRKKGLPETIKEGIGRGVRWRENVLRLSFVILESN